MYTASRSGRSSRSTLMHTNPSFIAAATSVVLERLVGHHVAPVARRVPDGQQDRHVARRRLGQRLGRPLLPVHRVVGVLAQVGAGGLGEGVSRRAHAGSRRRSVRRVPSSAACRLGSLAVERLGQLAQVPVHRPHQQERADQQQHDDHRPNGLALPKSGPVLRGASSASRPMRQHQRVVHVLDPREQVGLGQRRPEPANGPARIPLSARAAAAIRWAREEVAVGVDLGGVGAQGVVALGEVLRALDAGRHPVLRTRRARDPSV